MLEFHVADVDFDYLFNNLDVDYKEDDNLSHFRPVNCLKPFPYNGVMCHCGKCILCRVQQRSEWSLRLDLEALQYVDNAFATLTYDPKYVPFELDLRDCQLFLKRLRNFLTYPIRYFLSGEYGEKGTHRPHWHIIIFGLKIADYKKIGEAWQNGFVKVSCLSSNRIKYTCGYVQKKLHFFDVPSDVRKCYDKSIFERSDMFPDLSFEQLRRQPFAQMSRMPGLGSSFYDMKKDFMNDNLSVYLRGKKYLLPRFYRKKLSEDYSDFSDRFSAECEQRLNEKFVSFLERFPGGSLFDYLLREESKVRQRARVMLQRDEVYCNEHKKGVNYV